MAFGRIALGCESPPATLEAPPAAAASVFEASPPSAEERYCAWFGDARDGVLYFGLSPFWASFREAGHPLGDMERTGPQLVGRFDLVEERFLPPLPTAAEQPRAGTWDVLAHPNGRVYYTAYFEPAGWVEPATGASGLFEAAGSGLNELALGPEQGLLATRYAAEGSVVLLDADGRVRAEHPLEPPPNGQVWAKSVAYDAARGEIWVTTDLLVPGEAELAHDARVLDASDGRELRRIVDPEIQFAVFAPDGAGHLAEVEGSRLFLRVIPPAGEAREPRSERRILLDGAFAAGHDFVQELVRLADGGVIATRWSGIVHRVDAAGRVRSARLPRAGDPGLYYTGVLADGRLCATRCAGVEVVCAAAP